MRVYNKVACLLTLLFFFLFGTAKSQLSLECYTLSSSYIEINCEDDSIYNFASSDSIFVKKYCYSTHVLRNVNNISNCECNYATPWSNTIFIMDSSLFNTFDLTYILHQLPLETSNVYSQYQVFTNYQLDSCYMPPAYCFEYDFYSSANSSYGCFQIPVLPSVGQQVGFHSDLLFNNTHYTSNSTMTRDSNILNLDLFSNPYTFECIRIWYFCTYAANQECNSTPHFADFTPNVFCNHTDIVYDCSATDGNGDSLVYSLCHAYYWNYDGTTFYNCNSEPGPYAPIPYMPGYSLANLIGGAYPLSIDPHTGIITARADTAGVYSVTVCVEEWNGGVFKGKLNRELTFYIEECAPAFIADVPPKSACVGYSVQFENNSYGGMAEWDSLYHWDFGVGGTLADTSRAFAPLYTYPDTGTYTVMLIAGPGRLCADTSYSSVYVYPGLFANFNTLGTCVDLPLTFYQSAIDSYNTVSSWFWVFDDSLTSTAMNPVQTFTTPGYHTVSLVVENTVGCIDTLLSGININAPITASALGDTICPDGTATLQAFGGSYYVWLGDSVTQTMGNNTANAAPTTSSIYTVIADPLNGCPSDTATAEVFIDTTLSISTYGDTTLAEGGVAMIGASGGLSYSWQPSGETSYNINAQPLVSTTYTVVATDVLGCTASANVRVEVAAPFILLPNAFSPDGDNINDVFQPFYSGIASLDFLRIYNRWGEVVFETNNLNQAWNGTYKGEPQPLSTYIVQTQGSSYSGQTVTANGNVTLVR